MERIIEIDGQKVPVTEEVYQAYMRPEWKEKKRWQRLNEADAEAMLSIEQMLEDGVDIPYYGPTVEQIVLLKMMMEELHSAMEQLAPDERALMELVGEGWSDHQIAEQTGTAQTTVSYRRRNLLKKIRKDPLYSV
jgi:RNA polymerase sigma factor (sigma-70 family)